MPVRQSLPTLRFRDQTAQIETHLSKTAADDQRFHPEMTGQFGRMIVFERAAEK